MADFSNGVKGYITASATVHVTFPVDLKGNPDVCCAQCYYFVEARRKCGLNNEICEFPNKYIGSRCPLNFEKEIENESI